MTVVAIGRITFNRAHRMVSGPDGRRIPLTGAMLTLLETLAAADGRPVSRNDLCRATHGRDLGFQDRAVDQLVFAIRAMLPTDRDGAALIESVRGFGYWMRAPVAA